MATMTPEQLTDFIEQGYVTIDTPLQPAELTAAGDALERLAPLTLPDAPDQPRYRASTNCHDPALLDIVQHPFFEEVAKQVLNAETVQLFQTVAFIAYPQPDTPFSFDQHVDIQYHLSDFESTPRRVVCSFFLWLNGVNERRSPMMFRPGSHLLLARENERRGAGEGEVRTVRGAALEQLPQLDYAPPIPLLAEPGQVSVLTTSAVHGGSTNIDDTPRQAMIITFAATGVEIGLPPEQAEQKQVADRELYALLRPERRHIIAH
jgi:ectoine hydroxylase-related dioxygenase (phytanoyl-CoA dioxygenase family)